MSNVLEFYLKLKDMMSSGLVKVAAQGSKTFGSLQAGAKTAQEGINKMAASNSKLALSYTELERRIESVTKKMNDATDIKRIETYRNYLNKLNQTAIGHVGNTGNNNSLTGLLGVGAVGYAGKAILTQSLQQAAAKENALISYKVLTGSGAFGSNLYNNIVKMADTTPFESGDLNRGAKTLLGYGVDKKRIMPYLGMFGDIASAQDNPAEALHSISLAFGQIYAKGHLAGQEVLQLVNAGFNPLKEISIMTGKSMNDLDKEMSKGLITVKMVEDAFVHATSAGGKYNGMMIEQSRTLGGQYSTFMDLVHSKLRAFGTFISPAVKGLMGLASSLLNNKMALTLTAVAFGVFASMLVKSAFSVGILKTYLDVLKATMATNPATMWIAGLSILVGVIISLSDQLNLLGDETNKLNKDFADFTKSTNLMKEVNTQAAQSAGEHIAKAKLLMERVRDLTLHEKIRKQALQELKQESEDYFGKLTMQSALTDKATESLKKYTEAITTHATAIAAADMYKTVESKFIETQMKNFELVNKMAASEFYDKFESVGAEGEINTHISKVSDAVVAARRLQKEKQLNSAAQTERDRAQMFLKTLIDKDKNSLLNLREDKQQKTALGETATEVGKSVASGGPRVINIHGVKFMDKLELHVNEFKEGVSEAEDKLMEMFLRLLQSGAAVQ